MNKTLKSWVKSMLYNCFVDLNSEFINIVELVIGQRNLLVKDLFFEHMNLWKISVCTHTWTWYLRLYVKKIYKIIYIYTYIIGITMNLCNWFVWWGQFHKLALPDIAKMPCGSLSCFTQIYGPYGLHIILKFSQIFFLQGS